VTGLFVRNVTKSNIENVETTENGSILVLSR